MQVHVFRVTLNHTDPIVFYSSFEDQCSTGMVGIVNANSNHTLKSYERSSSSVAKAATPDPDDEAYGGVFVDADVLGVNKHNGGISGSDSDDDDDDHPGSTLNAFTGMPNGAGILEAPVFAGLAAVAMGLACAMA